MIRICNFCGKQFTTRHNSKFCSRSCASQSLSNKQLVTCPVCGKVVLLRNGRKFCSATCANTFRRSPNYRPRIRKTCVVCGSEFSTVMPNKQTCSHICTVRLKDIQLSKKYPLSVVESMHTDRASQFKYLWTTDAFREQVHNRMTTNNPVYMDGVVDKANQTKLRKGCYTNNFKYGNGKISEYERKIYEALVPLGFYYNYAIPTKVARDAFPDMHYSYSYKPDFVNLRDKLCVEIDGYGHSSKKSKCRDAKKEECLKFLGFNTVRFTHKEIDDGGFDIWLKSYLKNI